MAHHSKYILKVTAGPTYNPSTHSDVHVNTEKPIIISSEFIDARIRVRIRDYRGLPKDSPSTSPYFAHSSHPYDRYSISFSFSPKSSIRGDHLVFGNDFDHPIRDRLPPLFDKAFGIVKWWIDPGLDGDVLSDEPWLYGALLSSINVLRIGTTDNNVLEEGRDDKDKVEGEEVEVISEGADGDGQDIRAEHGVPAAPNQRMKYFLAEDKRKFFKFEAGREYKCDFFNPYLDFNEFVLKLGYSLPAINIVSHWDGQPLRTHSLRYVLKNRNTNTELFVIVFQLIPTEEAKMEHGVESAEDKFDLVHGRDVEGGVDDELD